MSAILYSTTTGSSEERLMVTVSDRGVALVNEFMYRRAKVKDTGSFNSMMVACSGCQR